MTSLKKLILKYGQPDALIDHWNRRAKKLAIWGFDEIFIYDTNGCWLNGEKVLGEPIDICNNILKQWDETSESAYAIGYIS